MIPYKNKCSFLALTFWEKARKAVCRLRPNSDINITTDKVWISFRTRFFDMCDLSEILKFVREVLEGIDQYIPFSHLLQYRPKYLEVQNSNTISHWIQTLIAL